MNPTLRSSIESSLSSIQAPSLLVRSFLRSVDRWRSGESATIPASSLEPIGRLPALSDLPEPGPLAEDAIRHTVVIKLNGGLGTSMGLERAKSLIVAKNGLTFLDIIVRQIEFLRQRCRAPLPLLLMDSFSTDADTLAALAANHPSFSNPAPLPLSFCQHRVPKLDPETALPVTFPANPALEWCPPGHADIYLALQTTGILDTLLDAGFRYAFVSNADNLGALLHMGILEAFAARRLPFWMEVTRRTEVDRKGGHLTRDAATHRLLLRESAQCPPGETADFQDIAKYDLFNTNNLWIDLESLRALLDATGGLPTLPLIVNRKTVDPTDPSSPPCVQLESAMGSAISLFEGASALVVPRFRFAPVKTTNDLLAIRSDLYSIGPENQVALRPDRFSPPPEIRLDPRYYKNIADFESRFPHGAPSLLQCESLTVEGDITFGPRNILAGRVHLRNPTSTPA
ncbi:MAG: UTP--glucose-1-phosphate uridylyltransferase, partial [Kiritimatiellae bacterium]|nr:UTP--glucose-1-phosphate uridylyltransferase [Kiritimatiellia bacterium]